MHSYLFTTVALAAGLVSAGVAPRATPTPTSSSASTTCTPGPTATYTVVSGDTLTIISQKFSSGICNIASANSLTNPNVIDLGQVLIVPTYVCDPDNTSCLSVSEYTATCATGVASTYTIVSGDTFFLVAQALKISTDALLAANPGVDPLLLQVGQVINVPVCDS